MSTVSFRLFKLQEINVPVGVVTLLATTGDSASGSFVALLLSVKAKIANKEQVHKLKIILFHTDMYLVSTVFLIGFGTKVG